MTSVDPSWFLIVGALLFGSGAFFFATSHTITRMEPLLVVIGLALLAWSIYRLRRRFGSKLGTFSLSTGAYYVESDGGRLNVWDRSRASGIRFHHNYHRGLYTGTVMIFEYPGASLAIGDVVAPIDADEELLARSRIFQQHLAIWRTARDARAAGAFDRIDGFALVPPGALD